MMGQKISDSEMIIIIQNDINSFTMRANNTRKYNLPLCRYYEGKADYARKVLREMLGEDENLEDYNNE